ncbi:copper amine oxidase N-terminal domain-containing protein [Natranaerofaba carboxydovora]|uniref:copper amine oxidase N-terminal domain-containing protein n=1 Tax=Natranaerofaba carboxydovora TaxID=2742683 RepID=UPI001F14189E|nr:stalk domain-containing protein [Natranaerofaba carboxydovora]UMZ72791.1 hypothetical protein ACONDI_00319 [Natranaerofaba carboxydovora]
MKNKILVNFLIFLFILSTVISFDINSAEASNETGWYLTESRLEKPESMSGLSRIMGTNEEVRTYTEIQNDEEGDLHLFCHRYYTGSGNTIFQRLVKYKWISPADFIAAGEPAYLNGYVDVEFKDQGSPRIIAKITPRATDDPYGVADSSMRMMTPDGRNDFYQIDSNREEVIQSHGFPQGEPGEKMRITLMLQAAYSPLWHYVYEWREGAPDTEVEPITSTTPEGDIDLEQAQSFSSGTRLSWSPVNSIGYRIFRSTSQNELGISVTDFHLTSTTFADVNVQPNTTYYYTVKPVLREANPLQGIEEELGDVIATFTTTTGDEIYKPGVLKSFIVLQIDNPFMSAGGLKKEIDPGRETTPEIMAGRTMVPIRAIVEEMGGSMGWDGNTQKITLSANDNTVEMWIGELGITVNNASQTMDIAPLIKNERTYIPLRFVAENLDSNIDWLASTNEIVIAYE